MFVKTFTLQNILSFGPHEQSFVGLQKYNLLIGPNGVGKSNVFRVLGALKVDIEPDVQVPIGVQTFGVRHESVAHPLKLDKSFFNDRNNNKIGHGSQFRITYETGWPVHGNVKHKELIFKNGLLVRGHVKDIERYAALIQPDWDNVSFLNSLKEDVDDPTHEFYILPQLMLNFALCYIFEREYTVLHSGELNEKTLREGDGRFVGGVMGLGFAEWKWPSGVFRVAKALQQILQSGGQKSLVLVEEPELHLEPRAIRRFTDLLRWLTNKEPSSDVDWAFSRVQKSWDAYHAKTSSIYRKPIVQAQDVKPWIRQIFVASHSPVLINEFLSMADAAVFEIDTSWMDHRVGVNLLEFDGTKREDEASSNYQQFSQQTTVRPVSEFAHSILNSLGASGADLLQCNGVVWVEGPSDAIYLEKWLEMYASENDLPVLRRHRHFEFQMYGGALLDSLCLIKDGTSSEEVENNKLVEMFSFSRNAFIVIDSDAVKTADGTVADQSSFRRAKQFVKEQATSLNEEKGCSVGLWYAEGNTSIRTIEDYLDQQSVDMVTASQAKNQKKRSAQIRVDSWGGKALSDFPNGLEAEVTKLFDSIVSWQR